MTPWVPPLSCPARPLPVHATSLPGRDERYLSRYIARHQYRLFWGILLVWCCFVVFFCGGFCCEILLLSNIVGILLWNIVVVNYLRPILLWDIIGGRQEIFVTFGTIFLTFATIFVTVGIIFLTFGTILLFIWCILWPFEAYYDLFEQCQDISGPFKDMYWHFASIVWIIWDNPFKLFCCEISLVSTTRRNFVVKYCCGDPPGEILL